MTIAGAGPSTAIAPAATIGPIIVATTKALESMALARSQRWRGTTSGKSVRSPVMLKGAVSEVTMAMSTNSSAERTPASESKPMAEVATMATTKSSPMRRTRPWRSSSAPAIGLTRTPGAKLAKRTRPASVADPNSASVNNVSAMPPMACAVRDRNSEATMCDIEGSASRAR